MERVFFELELDTWHGQSVESMWATKLGDHLYKIEGSPFFVKGITFEDAVKTKLLDGVISFVKTATSSGGSTYRILCKEGTDETQFERFWKPLEVVGCTYEQGDFGYRMYSVDVPKQANIQQVFALLQDGISNDIWDFEEGHCGHPIQG